MTNLTRVLVVDENESDAVRLIDELELKGLAIRWQRVDASTNFGTALNSNSWDVIIADYRMATLESPHVLSQMRELRSDVPVIIVSDKTGEDIAVESIRNGACDYILRDDLRRLAPAVQREVRERQLKSHYKIAQNIIEWQAEHDPLTGLANRQTLNAKLQSAIESARASHTHVAVLFLDIDHFKEINNTFGFEAGDAILKQIAARLRDKLGPRDAIARRGGDNFKILLTNLARPQDVYPVAQSLLDTVSEALTIDNEEVFLTACIGISVFPDDAFDAEDALRHADRAEHDAKEQGACHRMYKETDHETPSHRVRLAAPLRHAVERNELVLYYQPQIQLKSGRLFGFEGLVRWKHPVFGLIPPIDFIPLAERNGLIVQVGEWVIEQACRQAVEWEASGSPVRTFVNLSARQLDAVRLVPRIHEIIESSGIKKELLGLELTETALFSAGSQSTPLFNLGTLGVNLALDDFGMGYSSLSLLRYMPVQIVKIDRSFISGFTESDKDQALVSSIIHLAHSLGLIAVAEGVTSEKELDLLKAMNCDVVQGFLFSEPIPVVEATSYLKQHGSIDSEPKKRRIPA